MVVLSVGLLPAYDPKPVFQVPIGDDGFVEVPAPNHSPCVTDRHGIFVTGTAAGPMDIVDSIVMAGAAAAESAAYIEAQKNDRETLESVEGRREPVHA
jgi:heterodisulfide reductase subunit A